MIELGYCFMRHRISVIGIGALPVFQGYLLLSTLFFIKGPKTNSFA